MNLDSVAKKWGYYQDLLRQRNLTIKTLTILPGEKISNQKHFERTEKWYILSGDGEAVLQHGNSIISIQLETGTKFFVDLEVWHQVKANEGSTLSILEIQEGKNCSEDDIERKEDVL